MAPLMIIGSVPLYNIMAVIVLSFFQPEQKGLDSKVLKKTLIGILTNPIILGIVAGFVWSALKIPMPQILNKTATSIGATATPLGLMAMGAMFDIHKALGKAKPAVTATFIKLIGLCYHISSDCSFAWISKRRITCDTRNARVRNNCCLLCHVS